MSQPGSSLPPLPVSIPHMLSERARATPDREAFVFFDQNKTITYRGLEEEVRRVAAGLSSMGVRKGTHVALMLPNIAEFPVTWLALAWLGAISVQLTRSSPAGSSTTF